MTTNAPAPAPALLDPWQQAEQIAHRLSGAGTRLVVAIGARAWCERCRVVHPQFESLAAASTRPGDLYLWLDVVEHDALLNGYEPADLPTLLVFDGAVLVLETTPQGSIRDALAAVRTPTGSFAGSNDPAMLTHPALRVRAALMAANWARQ